jgi:hypothetical protein
MILGSTLAQGGSISLGEWYEFGFDPNHSPLASGCAPADPEGVPCRPGIGSIFLDASPWIATSSSALVITITDGLLAGDYFDVLVSGVTVGSTPAVPSSRLSCGLDPSVCDVTPGFSHAQIALPPGSLAITINVHPAQLLGEGFFRVDPVPEPGGFGLGLNGLLIGCLLVWRHRHRKHSDGGVYTYK